MKKYYKIEIIYEIKGIIILPSVTKFYFPAVLLLRKQNKNGKQNITNLINLKFNIVKMVLLYGPYA